MNDLVTPGRGRLLAAVLLCGSLAAQAGEEPAEPPKYYIRGVEARMPSETRSSEVDLIGLEESGNGFRDRTPMLEGGARLAKVDRDELRDQRLSAYGTPPSAVGPDEGPAVAPAAQPVDLMAAGADRQADVRRRLDNFRFVTITIGGLLLAVAVVIVMRSRGVGRQRAHG